MDKDSLEKRSFSLDKLHGYGVKDDQIYFVGAPNELEELYSDQQWADTANELWSRADGNAWEIDDIAQFRTGKKFSDQLLEAFRVESESGPSSKQEMNMKLVHRLKAIDQVPTQLREKLEAVARLANGVPR